MERSQLRWLGHVSTMSQERLARQVLLVTPTWKQPIGRPRTRWCDYTSDLISSRLGVDPKELPEIVENRDVFRVLLGLLSPRPLPEERRVWKWQIEEIRICILSFQHFFLLCRWSGELIFGYFHVIRCCNGKFWDFVFGVEVILKMFMDLHGFMFLATLRKIIHMIFKKLSFYHRHSHDVRFDASLLK